MMRDKLEALLLLLLASIVIAFIFCIFIAGVLTVSDIIGDSIRELIRVLSNK